MIIINDDYMAAWTSLDSRCLPTPVASYCVCVGACSAGGLGPVPGGTASDHFFVCARAQTCRWKPARMRGIAMDTRTKACTILLSAWVRASGFFLPFCGVSLGGRLPLFGRFLGLGQGDAAVGISMRTAVPSPSCSRTMLSARARTDGAVVPEAHRIASDAYVDLEPKVHALCFSCRKLTSPP